MYSFVLLRKHKQKSIILLYEYQNSNYIENVRSIFKNNLLNYKCISLNCKKN
jgi:hypothetical protein